MRRQALLLLLGATAPLVGTHVASAEFVGIQSVAFPGGPAENLFRIYAVFDNPGQDEMIAVAGTLEHPLSILIGGGSFYQHPLGGDTAPSAALIQSDPDLAFDTFVTIGVKSVGPPDGQPVDNTVLPPLWPGFRGNLLAFTDSLWYVVPGSPQGDPFDPVNAFPGTGRILLGQFAAIGGYPDATMLLMYRSDGVIEQRVVEFTEDYTRCNDQSDCPDHPCFGSTECESGLCYIGESQPVIWPTPDCNDNLVLDSCDIDFGTSLDNNGNGVPDECDPECPWDCGDGNGHVDVADLLALLGGWGQPGSACDFDGSGIAVTDLLDLLAHWGPCP